MKKIKPNASTKKKLVTILHRMLQDVSLLFHSSTVLGYPTILTVEVSSRCNLHCPTCPKGTGRIHRNNDMDYGDFCRIVDQTCRHTKKMFIYNYGDPFMNASVCNMIKYAKKNDLYVQASTNGMFFGSPERRSEIIASGLDHLVLAIDGATQETLEMFRKGAVLSKIMNDLKALIGERDRLRRATPYTELQFIVMKHNQHELGAIEGLARNLGVDNLFKKTVWIDPKDPQYSERCDDLLPTSDGLRRDCYRKTNSRNKICKIPWQQSVITSEGDVIPCCYDWDGQYVMGNILKQSFESIWNGPCYRKFRKSILSGLDKIDICSKCPFGSLMAGA
ncbi:MAG: radical SAM/SPASM domain-containing protein [Planctomycetota bacterium]